MQEPCSDYTASVISSKPDKGKKRRTQNLPGNAIGNTRNGRTLSTLSSWSREAPFFARNGVQRLAEETTGHWGDLEDSEGEAEGQIDWKARATMKFARWIKLPKGLGGTSTLRGPKVLSSN